jgi:hypothetical protein
LPKFLALIEAASFFAEKNPSTAKFAEKQKRLPQKIRFLDFVFGQFASLGLA